MEPWNGKCIYIRCTWIPVLRIEFFCFCVFIVFKSVLLWGIHKNLNFVKLFTHILQTFSANSCKLTLLLSFLVIAKVAGLSVFKCIEVFCDKGGKDFNVHFIANNSLQVYDSKRSFVIRFLWQVCFPDSFSKIAHIAQLLVLSTDCLW